MCIFILIKQNLFFIGKIQSSMLRVRIPSQNRASEQCSNLCRFMYRFIAEKNTAKCYAATTSSLNYVIFLISRFFAALHRTFVIAAQRYISEAFSGVLIVHTKRSYFGQIFPPIEESVFRAFFSVKEFSLRLDE